MNQKEFDKIVKRVIDEDITLFDYKGMSYRSFNKELTNFYTLDLHSKLNLLLSIYGYLLHRRSGVYYTNNYIYTFFKDFIKETLLRKGKEYGGKDDDRLHNFKVASEIAWGSVTQTKMIGVCMGFQLKHLASISDLLMGQLAVDNGVLDEKIGDAVNYCILEEAIKQSSEEL